MQPAQLLFVLPPPVMYAVVVPALRLREGRGTCICGGFCSLKNRATRPAHP